MPARNKENRVDTESMERKKEKENEEKDGGNGNGDSTSQKLGSIKKRKRVKEENGGNPTKKKKQIKGDKDGPEGDDTNKTKEGRVDDHNNCKKEAADGLQTEQEEEEEIVTWQEIVQQQEQRSEIESDDDGTKDPKTPERAATEYQEFRNAFQPPSIKQQRRDAIRKHKQAAQYPANFRGQQLFPPDFEQHASLRPSTQTRKFRQLAAQANDIKKDYFDDLP